MSAGRRSDRTPPPGPSRRGVLRAGGVALATVAVGGVAAAVRGLGPPEDSRGAPGVLPPFITPVGSFYAFANGPWPAPAGGEAPLLVAGAGMERSAPWSRLAPLASARVTRTLSCDGNGYISAEQGAGCRLGAAEVDPEMSAKHPPALHWDWRFGGIGNAEWDTLSVGELFAALDVPTHGAWLHAVGRDGYRRSFPREVALDPDFRVAMGMNGAALPHPHGAPARLLAPGQYGAMCVKWVRELRFGPRDEPVEAEGGAQTAYAAKPLAFATLPEDRSRVAGRVELGGIAYAGPHAVHEVALWTGDRSWVAELVDPPARHVWTRWRSGVELPPGEHTIRIACVDSAGRQSTPQKAHGEAVGYGGLHVLRVRVG